MSEPRPPTPKAVERALRQEAGFGCAMCGCPFVVYHHIVPWEEEHHFRVEDMMAVCPNCHSAVERLPRDRQYKIKEAPYNIEKGFVKGSLVYDGAGGLDIGGNFIFGTPYIIAYNGDLVLGYGKVDGENSIYANIVDERSTKSLLINWNSVEFAAKDFWDFEFKWNYVKVRNGPRNIFFELDMRQPRGFVRCSLVFGRTTIDLQKDALFFRSSVSEGKNVISNNTFGLLPHEPCIHVFDEEYLGRINGMKPPGLFLAKT